MSHRQIFKTALLGAAVVSLLAGWPGAARASDTSIGPSLTVKGLYATNVGYDAEGTEKDDFITTVTPAISLSHSTRRGAAALTYSLDRLFHAKYDNLDRTSHNGSFNMNLSFSEKTSVTAADTLVYDPDSLGTDATGSETGRGVAYSADTSTIGAGGLWTARTDRLTNTATAGVTYDATTNTNLALLLTDTVLEFSGTSLIDTRTDSAALKYSYRFSPETSLNADYTYTVFTFRSGSNTEIDTHAATLGFTRSFTPSFTVVFSAGANYTPDANTKTDWKAGVSASKDFRSSQLNLGYNRRITNTSGLSDSINVNETYSMTYDHTFTRSLSASLSGRYDSNKTKPSTGVDSTSASGAVSALWRPEAWLAASLRYNHFIQWSDSATVSELSNDSIQALATFTPESWRPFSAQLGYNRFMQNSETIGVSDITNNTYFVSVTLAPDPWRL